MIVHIHDWGYGSFNDYKSDWNLGLEYTDEVSKTYCKNIFYVIDKRVFMLSVIKLGMKYNVFEEV